jgi:hypothetical protein
MPPLAKIGINIEGELFKTLHLEEIIGTKNHKKYFCEIDFVKKSKFDIVSLDI